MARFPEKPSGTACLLIWARDKSIARAGSRISKNGPSSRPGMRWRAASPAPTLARPAAPERCNAAVRPANCPCHVCTMTVMSRTMQTRETHQQRKRGAERLAEVEKKLAEVAQRNARLEREFARYVNENAKLHRKTVRCTRSNALASGSRFKPGKPSTVWWPRSAIPRGFRNIGMCSTRATARANRGSYASSTPKPSEQSEARGE